MADVSRLTLKFDTDGVERTRAQTRSVSNELDHVSTRADHAGSRFAGLWKAAAGAFAVIGVAKLTQGVAGVVGMASDMQETASKTSVVFGSSFGAIEEWSKDSAKLFGLSQTQAMDTVSTYGAMASAAGLSGKAQVKFGQDLVGAAADLGSFWNFDPSQVAQDIRSGLAGEAEPLRKYNIFLNETAVKAKAAELGLGGVNGELTDQEKVLARQAIIMDQLGPAAGDYLRTSDGLANSSRTLKANFANLQVMIGKKLIPVVTKITNGVNDFVSSLVGGEGLAAALRSVNDGDAPGFIKGIAKMVDVVSTVIGYIRAFSNAMRAAFGPTFAVKDLVEFLPAPLQRFERGLLLIANAVGHVVRAFQRDGLSGVLDVLPRELGNVWTAIQQLVGGGLSILGDTLLNIFSAVPWAAIGGSIVSGARAVFDAIPWTDIGNAAIDLASAAFNAVPWGDIWSGITTVFDGLRTAFDEFDYNNLGVIVGEGIRAAIEAVGPTILQVGEDLISSLKEGLEGQSWQDILKWAALLPVAIPAAIVGATIALAPKAAEFMEGLLEGLGLNWDETVVPWLQSLPSLAVNAIGNVTVSLWLSGFGLISGLWDGAIAKWFEVSDWLGSRGEIAVSAVGNLVDFLWQRGIELIEGLWDGAGVQWTSFTKWLAGLGQSAVDWVGDLSGILYGAGADAVQGMINGANSKLGLLQGVWNTIRLGWMEINNLGNSPWPLMIEAGQDAMDGLIIGAQSRMNALNSTIGNATAAFGVSPSFAGGGPSGALSLASTGSGSGRFGGGNTYITYVLEPGTFVGIGAFREMRSQVADGTAKIVDRRGRSSRIGES